VTEPRVHPVYAPAPPHTDARWGASEVRAAAVRVADAAAPSVWATHPLGAGGASGLGPQGARGPGTAGWPGATGLARRSCRVRGRGRRRGTADRSPRRALCRLYRRPNYLAPLLVAAGAVLWPPALPLRPRRNTDAPHRVADALPPDQAVVLWIHPCGAQQGLDPVLGAIRRYLMRRGAVMCLASRSVEGAGFRRTRGTRSGAAVAGVGHTDRRPVTRMRGVASVRGVPSSVIESHKECLGW